MRRRHRSRDGHEKLGPQGIEVDLIPEIVGECVDGTGGIEAGAIEAAVDHVLNAPTDRLEERERQQRRCGDRELRA